MQGPRPLPILANQQNKQTTSKNSYPALPTTSKTSHHNFSLPYSLLRIILQVHADKKVHKKPLTFQGNFVAQIPSRTGGDGLRPSGGRTRHGNNLRQFKKTEHAVVGQTRDGTIPNSSRPDHDPDYRSAKSTLQKRKSTAQLWCRNKHKKCTKKYFSEGHIFSPPLKLSEPTIPTHDLQDQESITEK